MLVADYIAGKIFIGLFMAACAICDYKTKRVDIRILGVAACMEAFAYVWMIFEGVEIDFMCMGIGFAVGVFVLIVAGITKGQIGAGDAIFFMLTGIAMGGYRNILLLCAGMLMSVIYGLTFHIICFIKGRNTKGYEFALLPILAPLGLVILIWA